MEKISEVFTASLLRFRVACSEIMRVVQHFRLNMIGILQGQEVSIQPLTLPELFDKQFEEENFGSKLALIDDDEKVTFLELRNESEDFASNLVKRFQSDIHGVNGMPKVFGLLTLPGKARIVAILGLLKIKCAYVPLDFTQPPERMAIVLQDSGVKYLLCDDYSAKGVLQKVLDIHQDFSIVDITDLSKKDGETILSSPVIKKEENPLVCVLYTSGSTGKPKGVPCYTANLVNRLTWQWDMVPFSTDDIGCQKTSVVFIDFLTEVFGCLLKGIPLVILPRSVTTQPELFVKAINDFQISRLILVPSHLEMLIKYLQNTKNLDKVFSIKAVISSGECLQLKTARSFFLVFPLRSVLYNLYGSTETTGDVMFAKWEGVEDIENSSMDGVLSLGTPLYNTCMVLLNENKEPCKEGTIGHVYVSGQNIVPGYLNPTEFHSQSFIHNKVFSKEGHKTLFKIGDLGVVRDGRLYHQGRTDTQVKIRGHRVDLHEIEQIVKQVDIVDSCVVLPYRDTNGYLVPVVFYTSKIDRVNIEEQIKSVCENKLPKYALPRSFKVNEFPLQANSGKLDRQKLLFLYREKILNLSISSSVSSSLSKAEKILNVLSRNLSLPLEDIRQDVGFFENGGNSLTAITTISDLCSNGIELTMAEFLSFKSISKLLSFNGVSILNTTCALSPQYQPVMLNSVSDKDQAIDIIARGFSQKNPLDLLAGTTKHSVERLIRSFWREILSDDLSVAVIDKSSMEVVAVSLVLDLKTEITPVWDKPEVCKINEAVEEPVRRKLMKSDGLWADSLLAAVDPELSEGLSLTILEAMTDYNIQVLQRRGYNGICEVNSHPVTAAMAEERFGFVTMNTLHVRSFCYLGQYPFKDAEDTYVIKCMVKHFK